MKKFLENYEYIFKPFRFQFKTNHWSRFNFHICLQSEDGCMASYGLSFSIRIQIYKAMFYLELKPLGEIRKKR